MEPEATSNTDPTVNTEETHGPVESLFKLLTKTSLGVALFIKKYKQDTEELEHFRDTNETFLKLDALQGAYSAKSGVRITYSGTEEDDSIIPIMGGFEVVAMLHNMEFNNYRIFDDKYAFSPAGVEEQPNLVQCTLHGTYASLSMKGELVSGQVKVILTEIIIHVVPTLQLVARACVIPWDQDPPDPEEKSIKRMKQIKEQKKAPRKNVKPRRSPRIANK